MSFYPNSSSPLRRYLAQIPSCEMVLMVMLLAANASSAPYSEFSTPPPPETSSVVVTSAPRLPAKAVSPPVLATNHVNDIATNGMENLDDKYKLAVGDHISYQVIEDGDDPKSIVVSDSGDVEIPYIGPYPATGKTCKQLAKELKVLLEKKYYYQATVIISVDSMVTQGVIYLVGAVKSPGPMELPRDDVLTVSKAVLRAGGFTDFADTKTVRVTRKEESGTNEVFTVNVSDVLDKGKTEEDQPVESGDLIYVPEKTFNF